MKSVGVRELRQDASGILRRVEAGERLVVTVNGRPVARLEPLGRRTWIPAAELAELLGPTDPTWEADLRAAEEYIDMRVDLDVDPGAPRARKHERGE